MAVRVASHRRGSVSRLGNLGAGIPVLLIFALFVQCALSIEQPEKAEEINVAETPDTPQHATEGAESEQAAPSSGEGEKGTLHEVSAEELAKAGEAAAKAKLEREKDAEERRAFREAKAKQEAEEQAAREAELQKLPVTYGSVIVLRHNPSKKMVAGTNFKYFHPHSSNQHQVVAVDQEDSYTHWRVTPRAGQRWELVKDVPVKNGDVIRLNNMRTERALHSHQGPVSPYSGMNEVSNFGVDQGSKDVNDNWVVHVDGDTWTLAAPLLLEHAPTKAVLTSNVLSESQNSNFTFGHQEVSASRVQKKAEGKKSDKDKHDDDTQPPLAEKVWAAMPVGGAVGYDKYVAIFENLKDHEERYSQLNSDPANGPKEISIYCPQNPVVSISDLDYNLIGEGKCLALNLQAPHFEAALTLNCDAKK